MKGKINIQNIKNSLLRFLSRKMTSHVLLYHSCYPDVPKDLNHQLHNVTPSVMYEQLAWYKKNFDIVSLHEWFARKKKRGLAAITFDDAYKSVFEYGIKILEELNLPATIFVIGKTIEGQVFWRDKIRFLISRGEIEQFTDQLKESYPEVANLSPDPFYELSKSKHFVSILSNKKLEEALDNYLSASGLQSELENYCAEKNSDLVEHPLITYGNHSYSHYMFNSLDYDFLRDDITKGHNRIQSAVKTAFSDVLSVPFGGENMLTEEVIQVCKELNYSGILLNTNQVNGPETLPSKDGVMFATRFLMPESMDALIPMVERMTYDIFKKYHPLNR